MTCCPTCDAFSWDCVCCEGCGQLDCDCASIDWVALIVLALFLVWGWSAYVHRLVRGLFVGCGG